MFQFFDVDLLQCVRFGVSSRILQAKHNLYKNRVRLESECVNL